jgi:hypothetical protein
MMTKDEIEKMVSSYIEQSIGGLSLENSKFDFKREWYNLKVEEGIQEFIKDTTSMVNTFGPDGIILIGFDDKTKEFKESILPKDPSDIINLINKRVDRLFDINTYDITYKNHSLSVIHIPPSMDKPHIIRNYKTFQNGEIRNSYENVSLIRKNTSKGFSTRYDLDLMLWDNKNVVPDYRILSSYHFDSIHFTLYDDEVPKCKIYLTLENVGKRPVGIIKLKMKFTLYPSPDLYDILEFEVDYKNMNLIIPTGSIWNNNIELVSNSRLGKISLKGLIDDFNQNKRRLISSPLELKLSTGKLIESDLFKIE